jgi:DNA-binding response OmpR family regulator
MIERRAGLMPRILIVEDDDNIRFIMKEVLKRIVSESSIAAAASGTEFLRLLGGMQPDLILLDVRLPDIDGLTLYQELRGHAELVAVPVLFVTANPDLVARASLTGQYVALRKPFELDVLTDIVSTLLKQEPTPSQ